MNDAVSLSPFNQTNIANDFEFILKRSGLPLDVVAGSNIDYAHASSLLAEKIPRLLNKYKADRISALQMLDIESLNNPPAAKPLGHWSTVSADTGDLFFTNGLLIDMTGSEPHLDGWSDNKTNMMHSVSQIRRLIDVKLAEGNLEFITRTTVPTEDLGGKILSNLVSFRRPGSDQMLHMDLDYLQYFKSKLKKPTFQVDVEGTLVHVFFAEKRVGFVGLATHNYPFENFADIEELTNAKGMVLAELMGLEMGSNDDLDAEDQVQAEPTEVLRDMSDPSRDVLAEIGRDVPGFDGPDPEVPVPTNFQAAPAGAAPTPEPAPQAGSWQAAAAEAQKWDAADAQPEVVQPAPPPPAPSFELPPDIAAKIAAMTGGAAVQPPAAPQAPTPAPVDQAASFAEVMGRVDDVGLGGDGLGESVDLTDDAPVQQPAAESQQPDDLDGVFSQADDDGLQQDSAMDGFMGDPTGEPMDGGFYGPDEGIATDDIPESAFTDASPQGDYEGGVPGFDSDDVNREAAFASFDTQNPKMHPAAMEYTDEAWEADYGRPLPKKKDPELTNVAFELGEPINARAMSTEAYKLALQERMEGAVSTAHAKAILEQEAMSTGRNLKQSQAICEEYAEIMTKIGHEKSVDAAAYVLGKIFKKYSKVWDRPQAELEQRQDTAKSRLDALNKSLDKDAAENEPPQPAPSMGEHRRTNADEAMDDVKDSLDQDASPEPSPEKAYRSTTEDGKGFYADPQYMAKRASAAVDALKPEHLLNEKGEIDNKWISSFKDTMNSITKRLEESDLGKTLVDALKEMMEKVRATFESLIALAMRVFGKDANDPKAPSNSGPAPGM